MKMLGAIVVALLVGLGLGYWLSSRNSPSVPIAEHAVRQADVQVAEKAKAVEKAAARVVVAHRSTVEAVKISDSLDRAIRINDDTTLHYQVTPTAPIVVEFVPPWVTAKMRADSATKANQATEIIELVAENAALYQKDTASHVAIAARDTLIVALKKGRCGTVCRVMIAAGGFALGALVRR